MKTRHAAVAVLVASFWAVASLGTSKAEAPDAGVVPSRTNAEAVVGAARSPSRELRWYLLTPQGKEPQAGPQPSIVREAREDDALRACLADAVAPQLSKRPERVEVMLHVRKGIVRRAQLGDGLLAAQCLTRFDKRDVPELTRAVWIVFEVPLPEAAPSRR